MQTDEALDERQPKPRAGGRPARFEGFEYARLIFRRNAATGIADPQPDQSRRAIGADRHFSANAGISESVRQQVEQDLFEPARIGAYGADILVALDGERDLRVFGLERGISRSARQQFPNVDVCDVERHLARIYGRQVDNVGDKIAQMIGRGKD